MSKRWTLKDDLFLAEYSDLPIDYIASHDLGHHGKGAGTKRIAKLKAAGVWEKLIAHHATYSELCKAHALAFGPKWAVEMLDDMTPSIPLPHLTNTPEKTQ